MLPFLLPAVRTASTAPLHLLHLSTQRRHARGRNDDHDIPFASVNKFEWGGSEGGSTNYEGIDSQGVLTQGDLKDIIKEVLPSAHIEKVNVHEKPPSDQDIVTPATDPLLKVAELGGDKLAQQATHDMLMEDFPELQNRPGAAQVLGRYYEKSEEERRVMEGVIDDSLVPAGAPLGAPSAESDDQLLAPHFSPETRRAQIVQLTSQLTNSALHTLPDNLEAKQAAELHELSPWEYGEEEAPLPNEYWHMSHAERRFLGLPYKSEDGKWNPPLAHFTQRASEDINLKVFKDIMQKVRSHGGSRDALVQEEVDLLRQAEEKIFDHLRARLDDMTPFLDERSRVWQKRRSGDA